MCGIFGYYCFEEERPVKEILRKAFINLSARGTDASGFATIRDGELIVYKDAVASPVLVESDFWKEFEFKDKIAIFHTRAKTQGSEKVSFNNHPIFSKNGIAIVHNGMISNERYVYKQFAIEPDGEVDSEVILHMIAKGKTPEESIENVFSNISGSYAVASIDKSNPDRLILFRSSNPIELLFDKLTNILYFCSSEKYVKNAFSDLAGTYEKYGILFDKYELVEVSFKDDHGMVIEEAVSDYKKYEPIKSYYGGSYYGNYEDYDFGKYRSSSRYNHNYSKEEKKEEVPEGVKGEILNRKYIYTEEYVTKQECACCGTLIPATDRQAAVNSKSWCKTCKQMMPWTALVKEMRRDYHEYYDPDPPYWQVFGATVEELATLKASWEKVDKTNPPF